mgnify:CR=1 FL=1
MGDELDAAVNDTPTTDASSDTGDSGPEPPPPGDQTEACDAGDEAFVKRLIPLIQGRKPEGMREVLLLVSLIEQLDAAAHAAHRRRDEVLDHRSRLQSQVEALTRSADIPVLELQVSDLESQLVSAVSDWAAYHLAHQMVEGTLASGDGMVCLRHTSGLAAGLERLRSVISQQIAIFNTTADAWRILAARHCDDAAFDAYALRLFALTRGEGDDAVRVIEPDATVGRRLLDDVRPLFAAGRGNDRAGVRGTWWAAYNAVTEWLTHHRGSPAGTAREQAERRFDSLHLGPGRRLGVRALMLALDAAHDAPAAETAPPREDAPAAPLPSADLG